MIEVSHLVKKYGDHYAVRDLSFQVEKGQIYGFLGPNGAGKSTTMNMITGYLAPTSGQAVINGHDIQKEPEEAKACIGYLPEQPPVYPDMTVKEYLCFAAQLKRVKSSERADQVEEVMKMTRILDVKDRLIRNLSKGYKQRVGLSQALLGKPEILILDEPTVGLDPKQIIEIRDLIRSLRQKHTIILSSHILSEVSAVCDQIMIISKGTLVACDTPEGLSGLLTGGGELDLTVRGEKMTLDQCLAGMQGITEFKTVAEEEGTVSGVIRTEEHTDIREELFYRLAEKRMPILDMHMASRSLEDIFLELTDSEKMDTERDKEKERKRSVFKKNRTQLIETEQEEKENGSDI